MNDELLSSVEREVLTWRGVEKTSGTFGRFGVTVFNVGKRQIGHIHHDGVVDLQFPRAIHDELIAAGRAEPHRGGFPAVVSYTMRQPEDVPRVVELFRLSYDRTRDTAEARRSRTS
jgi:Family of unknown function (DUF5519)